MYYYIRFEKTAIIAKSNVEDLSNITFLLCDEIYQLVLIENKEHLIKQFDINDKTTYKLEEVNGKFFLNITKDCTELTGLNQLPEYKTITMNEYKEIIKQMENKLKVEGHKKY